MTEQARTTPTYQWAVATALTAAIVVLALSIAAPAIWLVIPAVAALALALWASIKNPALRTPASIATLAAAAAGGINIFFG